MIIRDIKDGEHAQVGEIRVAAYRAGGHLSADSEYAGTLRGLGADGHGQVLVAEDGGRIVGTIMLQFAPAAGQIVTSPDEAEIRALAVAPAGQGSGTGRALVEAVIELAARRGVRLLVLCTQPDMRTAHGIYERAGFRRLPERDWSPGDVTLLAYGLDLPVTATSTTT